MLDPSQGILRNGGRKLAVDRTVPVNPLPEGARRWLWHGMAGQKRSRPQQEPAGKSQVDFSHRQAAASGPEVIRALRPACIANAETLGWKSGRCWLNSKPF